ncbi:hypothetical protein [Sneathiella chinensis]|uniref:hypothetical protein n=1 Tax=Sneathiella chinensis TaxID=349750 RepID=UPI00146BA489|nr:hypothetical protein [Sneathiella chinensis]
MQIEGGLEYSSRLFAVWALENAPGTGKDPFVIQDLFRTYSGLILRLPALPSLLKWLDNRRELRLRKAYSVAQAAPFGKAEKPVFGCADNSKLSASCPLSGWQMPDWYSGSINS